MADYFFDTSVLVAYLKEEEAHTVQIGRICFEW